MPAISVVVPVYDVEKYLIRCVDSILDQTFTDFEIILVDDGSPDNCPAMCDSLAKEHDCIRVIHQPNGGLSAARNSGIEWALANSDSEWIAFIDSDDWIHPRFLDSMIAAADGCEAKMSMCGFCFTSEYKITELSDGDLQAEIWDVERAYREERLDPNSACGRVYRKEAFRDIRFPVGKLHEDRFTTYKLLFACDKVAEVDAPLYYYFTNENGIVHSKWTPRRLDNIEAAENQIAFLEKSKFRDAYIYTLRDCIHLITIGIKQTSGGEFKSYNTALRKKLRSVLKEYSDILGLSFKKDFNIYKYAYPVRAKVYRRLKGTGKK